MAQKTRILLVDDESAMTKVIGERLRRTGFDVEVAEDGQEALDKTRAGKPDLIILDVMLPKVNGYEVCAQLKREGATKHIPIIMFTAKGQTQEHLAGLMCGADAYVSKTCEFSVLMEQIQALFPDQRPA